VSVAATNHASAYLTHELSGLPDLGAVRKANPDRYPFILQSTAKGSQLGQFDILFGFPGETLCLSELHELRGPHSENQSDFLLALNDWWQQEQCVPVDSSLPFHGGWFLYLGYELAAQIEPTLRLQPDADLPTALAVRCPAAFVRDHATDRQFIVCETAYESYIPLMLEDAVTAGYTVLPETRELLVATDEDAATPFLDAVHCAKEYIAAGDVFQANLSRRWRAELSDNISPDHVYARLCAANPAPFAGMMVWNGVAVISSSPERLVSVRNRRISTRPIAGTRPRGNDEINDNAMSRELFGDAKERAEHVMLIDLERNDLGRVCDPGSVEVDEFMVLESYAHVHHIVSNIRGTLGEQHGPADAIRAVFPGGTITGCPKVRCMEIINELEQLPRGAYTGSIGYLNRDGSLDLNILIRTMVMRGNQLELRAGSGIVADSDPDAELAETRAKAKGLLLALS